MELQIIPKQNVPLDFDTTAIRIQYIENGMTGERLEGAAITEEVIADVLDRILTGTAVYLSLLPNGEDDWLEVLSDGVWLALGYSSNGGQDNYYSYNPDFRDTDEMSPLLSGGQSPVEKYLALTDLKAGQRAVEYFIRTGGLSPNIDWAKQL